MLDITKVMEHKDGINVELTDPTNNIIHTVDIFIEDDSQEIAAKNYIRNNKQLDINVDDDAIDAVATAICFLEINYFIWQDSDYKWYYTSIEPETYIYK